MVQRVAVIGAGISGLTTIKACLDENLEPVCFESSHDIGGLWRFKDDPEPGRANIYFSVIINSSKERMAFSDFPPPAEFPNNMHHSEMLQYLRLYAKAFKLLQHIRFQTTVVSVRQRPDFSMTGQWEVETESRDGRRETRVFDAVMVCTGHFTQPHLPLKDFPGIESFEGRYFHSWDYRNTEGLQGKRVVVIGIRSSGGDIAVDISRVAEKVYLSARSGAWVVSRVGQGGLPVDMLGTSRMDMMLQNLFPSWSARRLEKKVNQVFDHGLYGLKPRRGIFAQNAVVSDDLPARIISGRVQVKPNVKEFSGSSVVFEDGSIIDKISVPSVFIMVQRVAVIGAGVSGLTSVKACLDEDLEPTCFESSHDIGGLWRFKEKPEPGRTNIYQSVIINSSKEMMAFSDFPPPAELPNNMHHSEVLQYIRLYAQAFKLLQHIRFQTTVVSVRQRSDFPVTGQWEVETESRDGQRETRVFDAVIVSTGHFTQPHLPLRDFPGIETFEGRYFHSWDYRNAEGLQGKRVVVIGIGNSGGDIAVDISRVAEKVYLSTRSGAWVVGRVGPGGLPADLIGTSRVDLMINKLLPSWINKMLEKKLNEAFDHKLYGLKPKHGFFAQIPVVNDDLPARIIAGRVRVKPNVKKFSGSSVVFVDGSIIDKVDVVVFATGYNYSFPFLPSALQAKSGYRLRLYKHVFPPALTRPTLAVVGFIHGLGAINPLAEMQARWATRVFKGLATLPSEETMMKEVEKDTVAMHQRFACSERNPIQVDYIPYLDSLAEQVGVRPDILRLFLRDPRLALQVLTGPSTPYQYRLTGPGQWAGARQAILTQWERVLQPFRTRVTPEPETGPSCRRSIVVIFSGAALLCCFFYNKPFSIFSPLSVIRSPQ